MDDRERLIRLLMMVEGRIQEWHRPVGTRKVVDLKECGGDAERTLVEYKTPAEAAGHWLADMTECIPTADLWYRSGGTQGDCLDAHRLPALVLGAVSALPEDVVLLIGSWVKKVLCIEHADSREVGRLWVEDAKTTAWRLLIEHGERPGQHTTYREPLDATE
ncbi:hypothetical protein BC739_009387 [Kutzneria viridogrisea]|uniref:Uncharacterized protein n=1 Tax=Kutzneria viridogrisea TaxID=47990 RepID=A0ABR6BYZ0_9PSEU|nr:hypothetical protein [Kutzneria viridogrisea]